MPGHPPREISLSDAEAGYIAGLIDGEGSLDIRRRKRQTVEWLGPRVRVANTNLECLVWLVERLGGNIYPTNTKRPNCQVCYHYELENAQVIKALLFRIAPFLIIKKEKAEMLTAFIATMPERTSRNNRIAAIKTNAILHIHKESL
jgi:hypothetical protein